MADSKPEGAFDRLAWAVLAGMLHLFAWVPLGFLLLVIAPQYAVTFAPRRGELPFVADLVMRLSRGLTAAPHLLAVFAVGFFLADGLILYRLRSLRRGRTWGWAWFLLLGVIPFGLYAAGWLALETARMNLKS